jgi:hypothetical protein
VKLKTFGNKYDINMGDHKEYVNGKKSMTVQSDMAIRINGTLTIECDSFNLIASNQVNIKGKSINMTSIDNTNIASQSDIRINSSGSTDIKAGADLVAFGTNLASVGSANEAKLETPIALGGTTSIAGFTTLVYGGSLEVATITANFESSQTPGETRAVKGASQIKRHTPELKKTTSAQTKEPTDKLSKKGQKTVSAP